MKKLQYLALCVLVVSGCYDKAVAPYPVSEPPAASELALGAGDVFEVTVRGEPDLSGKYQVKEDGTINFPLVGRVAVSGKTASAIEGELQTLLADGYLKRPFVTVVVTEYNSLKVSVFGEVRTP